MCYTMNVSVYIVYSQCSVNKCIVDTKSKQQIREKILREIREMYYYLTLSLFSPAIRNRYYLILYTGDPVFYTQPTIPHC